MAVTVTDRRTTLVQGDSTSTETWNTGAAVTSAFAEATASIAVAYNTTTGDIYTTNASISLADTLIYVYTQVVATIASWTGGVHSLFLGDGTNQIAFDEAGSDRDVFKHAERDSPTGSAGLFQCFVLDGSLAATKNSGGETTVIAGTWAGFIANIGVVTEVGAHFVTLSKALGGGTNCYVDIIRYGNDGLRVTAGGVATEGTFLEIAVEDRSTATLKAHGIIREYTTGIYGCQGPLTFGELGAATNSYFEDAGIVLAFEARDIANDKYYFNVEGNAGATNSFVLSNSTISTAGPFVTCDFSAGNVDTLTLDTVVFAELANSITFSNSADASGHTVSDCTFLTCGQIDPGDVTFSDNTISTSTAAATGALLLDADGSANLSNLTFIFDTSGHAIYIPPGATGTYTLTNFTYTGYGITTSADAAIYNNSGGEVTLNISGGNSPTYLNGTSASTILIDAKTLTVTVKDQATPPAGIENVAVRIEKQSDGSEISQGLTNASGIYTDATYNYTGDVPVFVKVRLKGYIYVRTSADITDTGLDVPVTLAKDSIVNQP